MSLINITKTSNERLDEQLYYGLGRINGKLYVKGYIEKWRQVQFLRAGYCELKEFSESQRGEAKELIEFTNKIK